MKKTYASTITTIKKLLQMDIDVDIQDMNEEWSVPFKGKKKLTDNGFVKWADILNKKVRIIDNEAIIIDELNEDEINEICSLFNTLQGNVNEYTYKKYIEK